MKSVQILKCVAISVVAYFLCGSAVAQVNAFEDCGSLENPYGPFDYYDPANHLRTKGSNTAVSIVEGRHLTDSMLKLERGSTSYHIFADLDYTLRAVPNHPQALDLASRFEKRRSSSSAFASSQKPLKRSADCYFKRALMMTPLNSTVWMLYAIHAHRQDEFETAVSRYEKAGELGLDSPVYHYNFGLSLLAAGDLIAAKKHAEAAKTAGYPFTALERKLNQKGVTLGE